MPTRSRTTATKRTQSKSSETRDELRSQLRTVEKALKIERQQRRKAELLARQAERESRRLAEENERFRKSRGDTEKMLRSDIKKLDSEVLELKEKLEEAERRISWFEKHQFGKKTEKEMVSGDEPTEGNETTTKSAAQTVKRSRGQQPGKPGHGRTPNTGLDVDEQFLELANCCCDVCGKAYKQLPETDDSTLYEIDVQLYKLLLKRFRYAAQCSCNGKKIVTAPAPARLYPRTNLGPSMWEHLIAWKFLFGVPINRILKDLHLSGLSLSAGTVVGGFEKLDILLSPLYEGIWKYCQGAKLLHADETSWRVYEETENRKVGQPWWLWVFASKEAVVFILDESRSKELPQEFLGGSSGVLVTDRYSVYKGLSDSLKKALCWVHQRRDFLKVFNGMPKKKSWAKKWLLEISELFVLNEKRMRLFNHNNTFGMAWELAQKALEGQAEKLKLHWMSDLMDVSMSPAQLKALNSMKRHWPGLTWFLEDPRIPMDNNRAERLLRGPVVSRKNSYGSGSVKTGHFAAKVFSIYQTWLENGLNPKALMLDYFNECGNTPGKPPPDISQYLPWTMSEERKEAFKTSEKKKKASDEEP